MPQLSDGEGIVDVRTAKDKIGVAGYVLKPLKYEDYVAKIEKLLAYWSINELIKA